MRRIHSRIHGVRTRVMLLALCSVTVLGLAGASTFGASAAATGLVASYSFDAGSGTTLKDESGHGNTGAISSATWTNGLHGKALSFNGTNSQVRIPDAPSLDLTSGMTLEAWVYPTTLYGLWRTVVIKEMPGELAYALYAKGDSPNPIGIVNTGTEQYSRGGTALSLRRWQHLAATYDGTTARLYVNGSLASSVAAPGATLTSSGALAIGGNNVWKEWFKGSIDDVRVYNRPLSSSELRADMATAVTATAAAPTPPPTPTDTAAPSTPSGVVVSAGGQTSVSLKWTTSTDNVGVSGYTVYKAGGGTDVVSSTADSVGGLTCGTSYSFSVDAFDAAGNHSAKAAATGTTAACNPTDGQPPTTPTGLSVSGVTVSSLSLSWAASTDNTGVAGYHVYRNGTAAGTATTLSSTIGSLACGTSYTLAVDAYDAAGNVSAKAQTTGATAACPVGNPPPANGTAQLWVDANGGSCTRSSSPAAYADAQACGSLNDAYLKAAAGDLILIKAGSYGSQEIANRSDIGTAQVVFQPAPGESVTLHDLTIFAHDIAVQGGDTLGVDEPNRLTITQGTDAQMAHYNDGYRHIVLEDIHTESAFINAWATTLRYSEIGPLNVCAGRSDDLVKGWWFDVNGQDQGIQQLRVEYNDIHDNHDEGCSAGSPHNDAIQFEGDNSVIRGNHIWWCGTQCVFQGYDGVNDVIDNNMIEESSGCSRCGDSSEVGVAGTVLFQNNTVKGNVTFSGGSIPANATVRNNIFLSGQGCDPKAVYSYNVFPASGGSACGTNAKRGSPVMTIASALLGNSDANFNLSTTDSVAVNAGDPGNYSATDIDGRSRPMGGLPDAGAYEAK
jgi:chitodextrinase